MVIDTATTTRMDGGYAVPCRWRVLGLNQKDARLRRHNTPVGPKPTGMEQLMTLRQPTRTLTVPPTTDGDKSIPAPAETSASAGTHLVTRLTQFLTRRIGRLERALENQHRFASDVCHELRNPIAGLRTRLEEAQLHPDQISKDELIDQALHDVGRLETIVTDLLVLSRAEAANGANGNGNGGRRLERVDLAELVTKELAHRPDRLATERALDPGVAVMGVHGEIARVLANLLDNAQRHANRMVRVEARRDGGSAELIVSDDGDGIDPADREKIFERFVRLAASRERDRGGTGLGLGISREIAHTHPGTLEAGESSSGGARFVLRLPLARPASPTAPYHTGHRQKHPA